MTNFSKFCYGAAVFTSALTITMSLIEKNYHLASWAFNTLCWSGAAFFLELKCDKLEKKIEESKI
jgi:hypothetical protein